MIPYEDLVAALASFRNRAHGGAPLADEDPYRGHAVGAQPTATLRSHGDNDTHVGGLDGASPRPRYDEQSSNSNELDIDDVLSDEEAT